MDLEMPNADVRMRHVTDADFDSNELVTHQPTCAKAR